MSLKFCNAVISYIGVGGLGGGVLVMYQIFLDYLPIDTYQYIGIVILSMGGLII